MMMLMMTLCVIFMMAASVQATTLCQDTTGSCPDPMAEDSQGLLQTRAQMVPDDATDNGDDNTMDDSADDTNGGDVENTQEVCDETYRGKGEAYRGCQDKTHNGRTCQAWTSQSPHTHHYTPSIFPGKGLSGNNYCRNPTGLVSIWCYTTDQNTKWEYCIPKKACTGTFEEPGRPKPNTPCVGPCVSHSGRWGADYCFTDLAKKNWGAPCAICQGEKTFTECMAEQDCFDKYGNSTPGWVKNCLLCNPNALNVHDDAECIFFRECIRRNRGTLDDRSVLLLKNIDIVTGQSPADQVAVLVRESTRDCTDPSDEKFVRLLKADCGCLQQIHQDCDGAIDQQACLRQLACKEADVCGDWKTATNTATGKTNCDNSLTEQSARSNTSRDAAMLARSEAFKGLDESLAGKRTCR